MASRLFALIIWAAVAASLAYWGLRWLAPPTGVPHNAAPVSLDSSAHGELRRLLAGPSAASGPQADPGMASALASRIKLIGVVAPREGSQQGVALLSIDGKPPRAVRVGGVVDGDMVLQSLSQRGAQIGPGNGPVALTLELPPLPLPATGTLPPVAGIAPAQQPALMAPNAPQPSGMMPPPGQGASGASGMLNAPEGT